MKPTIGRIVLYKLTEGDVKRVTDQRPSMADAATFPPFVQLCVGVPVSSGEECAMVVTRAWESGAVNGKVMLDGNDVLWVVHSNCGDGVGEWHWPESA